LVVWLHVQAALADRQQPGPEGVGVEVRGYVCGVDDSGEPI
jgi:hypothetical protein